MTLTRSGYKQRLLDEKVKKYLGLFGAVSIEGPKWCGKTWLALNHANSATYLTEQSSRDLAMNDPKYIFDSAYPQLIDEWQTVPKIWDAVRNECDTDNKKGKFILTGSTTLEKDTENQVYHSGAGRIATIRLETMSLYESGDSTGIASISDMKAGSLKDGKNGEVSLEKIAEYIIRGGWPNNLNTTAENAGIIPREYISTLLKKDIHEQKDKRRDTNIMQMILRSLARNESSLAGAQTIVTDIAEYESEQNLVKDRATVSDYLSVLDDLYLTAHQDAFSINYRSSLRVGKTQKRHLVDPSLSCACLGLTVEKLMNDHNTFGLMFEALVARDLRIYANYLDGHLYHFKDNVSGDEVDAIIEFSDGEYAAVEIKLSYTNIDLAKRSLMKFHDKVERKPKFMCVVVGNLSAATIDPETGIYIVPITALKP